MGSIVDDLRLPKDPPRTFDVTRINVVMLFAAMRQPDMELALRPICRQAGLEDYRGMTTNFCSVTDWKASYEKSRVEYLVKWLITEDHNRGGTALKAVAPPAKKA